MPEIAHWDTGDIKGYPCASVRPFVASYWQTTRMISHNLTQFLHRHRIIFIIRFARRRDTSEQIKSGFECFHAPSIDLSTVTSPRLRASSVRRKASTTLISPASPSQSSLPASTIRQRNDTSSSSFTVSPVVQESDLVVRFEIFIVKMPLLPGISGLQFRRICGDAWQYQMLGMSSSFSLILVL